MLATSNVAPETVINHYGSFSLRFNLKPLYIERTNENVGCRVLYSVFCVVVVKWCIVKLTYDALTIMQIHVAVKILSSMFGSLLCTQITFTHLENRYNICGTI